LHASAGSGGSDRCGNAAAAGTGRKFGALTGNLVPATGMFHSREHGTERTLACRADGGPIHAG